MPFIKWSTLFAGLVVCAAPAANAAGDSVPDFSITEAAKRVIPLAKGHAVGDQFTLKEYQPALVGLIAVRTVAMTNRPVSVQIGGVNWPIAADEPLMQMENFSGGDSGSLPSGSTAFCRPKPIKAHEPEQPITAEEQQLRRDRFGAQSRLCLVDTGGNGTFNRAFMTGLKHAEDRHAVVIEPINYKTIANVPIPGCSVAVVFHHQNFMHTPRFYAQVFLGGREIEVESLQMATSDNSRAPLEPVTVSQATPKDRLPMTLAFGPGRFTVLSIDSNTKTAVVRKDADWPAVPIEITQIIYRRY